MASEANPQPVREAVGIFFNTETLREAIDDLQASGFQSAELGLLAGEFTVKQTLGDLYTEVNEPSGDPNAPHTEFVAKESIGENLRDLIGGLAFTGAAVAGGAVVATAGVLGGAIAAATAGVAAVGAVGAILAAIIGESDAEYLEEQLDEGNFLLFVRTLDEAREKLATDILTRHSAHDVRIYSVA